MRLGLCEYYYEQGVYKTACGWSVILRPTTICDRCGRKSKEAQKDATSTDRPSDRPVR